jgi:hypothetical protein
MSQGVLVDGVPVGGNDYVAVLKRYRAGYFDNVVKLHVPLKSIFAKWDKEVVAALPAMKEINIVKVSYKPQGLRRIMMQQQQGGVVIKKQRSGPQGSYASASVDPGMVGH